MSDSSSTPDNDKNSKTPASIAVNLKFDSHGNIITQKDSNGDLDLSKMITSTGNGRVGKVAVTASYAAQIGAADIEEQVTAAWTQGTPSSSSKAGRGEKGSRTKESDKTNTSKPKSGTDSDIKLSENTCLSYHKFSTGPDVLICFDPAQAPVVDKLSVGYAIGVPATDWQVNASFNQTRTTNASSRSTGTVTVHIPIGKASIDLGASTDRKKEYSAKLGIKF